MSKHCAIVECRRPLAKPWHLMCPGCWAKVPYQIQQRVYNGYKFCQGSPEHFAAIRDAIVAARGPADNSSPASNGLDMSNRPGLTMPISVACPKPRKPDHRPNEQCEKCGKWAAVRVGQVLYCAECKHQTEIPR